MRAVLETGGKQYWVKAGDILSIEKYSAAVGDHVEIGPLLFLQTEEEVLTDSEQLKQSKAVCAVLRQGRSKKVVVFKKKRRKNYRRTQGHRQERTRIEILEIVRGSAEGLAHGA